MEVAASEFYQGVYFTAFEPGEILTSIFIPAPAPGHGYAPGSRRFFSHKITDAASIVPIRTGTKVR